MIEYIRFVNAGPFKGEHEIRLGAKSYAITATHEDAPTRSNGSGKTAVLSLVRFAIDGQFPKHFNYDADGWISWGEKQASVIIELEGGAIIERSRKRGQSTQVRFTRDGQTASQADAEAEILKHLGFGKGDFANTVWLEQGAMARMLREDPAERIAAVSKWFGLGLADRADKALSEHLAIMSDALDKMVTKREMLVAQQPPVSDLARGYEFQKVVDERQVALAVAKKDQERARARKDAMHVVARRDVLVEEVRMLKAEVDEFDEEGTAKEVDDAQLAIAKMAESISLAKQNLATKKRVASGTFDGACPVAPLDCPIKQKINDDRSSGHKAYAEAMASLTIMESTYTTVVKQHEPVFQEANLLATKKRDLERAKDALKKVVDEVRAANVVVEQTKDVGDPSAVDTNHDAAWRALSEAESNLRVARLEEQRRVQVDAEIEMLDEQIGKETKAMAVAAKARACARAGSRRVAERNLAIIDADANDLLQKAGSDVVVESRWEREGKDPAKSCDECGASFPASAKVKECQRCGAPRGKHSVQRLDFVRSSQSGGLDDVAGVAMQLAAASWFLRAKESRWGLLALDEPYSACDASARRGLAIQLGQMARSSGVFRQLFVVSHSSDTSDMCQGRIEVFVKRDGTREIRQS